MARQLTICGIGAGSSTHVATRLRWFADRGHRVFLLTSTPSEGGIPGVTEVDLRRPYLTSPQSRVRRFYTALPSPLRGAVYYGLTALTFLRAARGCRPDVFQVHSAHQHHAWLAGLLGFRPLVVTVMGSDVAPFEQHDEPTTPGEWLTLRLLRQADYVTPPSDFLTEALERLGGFHGRLERIVWGVSLERFRRRDASALRAALGLRPEAEVVLGTKILRPFYRVHLVVEAMATVVRLHPDAVLVLTEYGADPAYRDQITRRAAELGLGEHVKLAGVVADEDMPAYYSLAAVSVAIPPRDGMPLALLESLACETPHVLSRLPRYEEIVRHEESAYFVDPDPDSIAAGILRLLEDDALRSRIAARGRRIVEERANLDEEAGRVERRFEELVSTTPPRTFRLRALLSAGVAAAQAYPGFRRSG
jgi:glycosyltransferase involved in cell wall biosynthesis